MFIREMALRLGSDYLEVCLKGMYKEYVANSRFVNPTSLPRIHFMASCVVELYGIDSAAAYQNAFIFIRQLAIVLRNALTMKTKVWSTFGDYSYTGPFLSICLFRVVVMEGTEQHGRIVLYS